MNEDVEDAMEGELDGTTAEYCFWGTEEKCDAGGRKWSRRVKIAWCTMQWWCQR